MTGTIAGASIIGRFALLADPTGAQVTYRRDGRDHLADVVGFYHRPGPAAAWMLKVRAFNGEAKADVALAAVRILIRTYRPAEE